jgi:hypothetical protein
VTVTVIENDLQLVLEKLDSVKLEILRLRAMLLPEGDMTEEERKEIDAAEKEMEKGKKISLKEFLKELGNS